MKVNGTFLNLLHLDEKYLLLSVRSTQLVKVFFNHLDIRNAVCNLKLLPSVKIYETCTGGIGPDSFCLFPKRGNGPNERPGFVFSISNSELTAILFLLSRFSMSLICSTLIGMGL